jgi:hypothetical protein
MAGSLLVSGNPQHYKAIGEGGQPVYSVAFQLREAIRLKAGAEVADCLAIPQPNQHGSVIDWYAPHAGDVVPWSTASVQEREDALAALDAAQGKLEAAAQAMRDTTGRNTQTEREKNTALRLITKAFYFPDPNFIFLVNGKPVITFWGFNTLGALLPSDPFGGLRNTSGVTQTAAAPTSKRSWWWWLLLLLLLLLLLFVLLRSCAPQSWLAGLPLSGQTVTEPDRARPPVSDAVPKPPDTVIDRGVAGLRRWWSGQTGQSITDTAGTPVTAGTTGTTTDSSGRVEGSATSTDTPVNNAPETSGVSGESAPLNSEAPSNTPTDQTQTPNAGQSANNATPPTTAQTPPTPDATTQPGSVPGAGNPLQIPNSAANTGSTNFLDGRWNAGAGIQDAKTGKPLRMEYDFSQGNGQGKVNIQRGDGTRCTGDVAAQMQGRSLNINDRGVAKCSDGSTMALPKVTCVPTADGRADCQGRYENGTSFPVSMRHAPK